LIKTKISKHNIKFVLDRKMKYVSSSELNFTYDIDISKTPKHVANYILGILLSEILSWNSGEFIFDELTRPEIDSIRYHVSMNHFSNPYGRISKDPIRVKTMKIVGGDSPKGSGPVLVCNGMGKDGLLVACLGDEITKNIKPFTVGNQYSNLKLWEERKNAMSAFYNTYKMPTADYIMTNYLRGADYRIIPWWVLGLPLAYAYDSNTIIMGCEIPFSKTKTGSKRLLRPNVSAFSYDSLSKATGIRFSSPTHAVTAYGAQKLLIERYPDALQYQRSCMKGTPWCNNCLECHKTSMYFENAGSDMRKIGLIPSKQFPTKVKNKETNHITQDIINKMHRKESGLPYNDFFEKANSNVFPLLWKGNELSKIFSEHFKMYSKDPGEDCLGYEYLPSKWGQWLKEGMV